MPRPAKPKLHGHYRSPDNRFDWDADYNPSPMRASGVLQRQTEGLPVLCDWCGFPFWPVASVQKGTCCEICQMASQQYEVEKSERDRLLDQLREQEVTLDRLRAFSGRQATT